MRLLCKRFITLTILGDNMSKQTAAICMVSGFLAVIVGYTAFVAGFYAYSTKLPRYNQTATVGAVNGLQLYVLPNTTAEQSYNDAVYFLQPTVNPHDIR